MTNLPRLYCLVLAVLWQDCLVRSFHRSQRDRTSYTPENCIKSSLFRQIKSYKLVEEYPVEWLQKPVKYFFLTEGWTVGRVWASDGLWNETAWRRRPDIQRLNVCLVEANEKLWLYRVEDTIMTVEVRPATASSNGTKQAIGQVVLKRLITAEQVIDRLGTAEAMCQLKSIQSVVQ